mmetsp:Transcript_157745/g.273738  ORF Transcript_157745/g.273738 Transcript_157745/m.273738 type:complete len:448 (+) Transcript_157745:1020-2363(+)
MVVLDTDMAPAADMLQLLLPPMLEYRDGAWQPNWRTGFVSSPQDFGNIERFFGASDPMNQSNKNYWRILPQALDSWGLVHFWGTNVAFFVPALKHSNGFMYGCITEDTVTGAALHRFGWESVFVGTPDVTLASGLCRETVSETFDQRKRWTQGNAQQVLTEINLRCLLHDSFRNPPYRSAYHKKIAELRASDRSRIPAEISPEDVGAKFRFARRGSYLNFLQRGIAYFSTQYAVLLNVMPMVYYSLSLHIVLTTTIPFEMDWRPVKNPLDAIDSFHIVLCYWLISSFANFLQNSYIMSDPSNSNNALWRAQQEYWGYSWVRMVGIVQGTWSAITGKQPRWNSFGMTGGVNLFLEMPNALAFIAMVASMGSTAIRFGLWGPGVIHFNVVAALFAGSWVLALLWPVTSCIFADFFRIPYHYLGNFVSTFVAATLMVSMAALWAIGASSD